MMHQFDVLLILFISIQVYILYWGMDIFSQRTLQKLRSPPQHRHIWLLDDLLSIVHHVRVDHIRDHRLLGRRLALVPLETWLV